MLRANVNAEFSRVTGRNGTGKRLYGDWEPVRVAIVHLFDTSDPTSVRTDSSASHAQARAEGIAARILIPAYTRVVLDQGDRLRFLSYIMTVQSIFPRHSVAGRLDHYQLELEIWKG